MHANTRLAASFMTIVCALAMAACARTDLGPVPVSAPGPAPEPAAEPTVAPAAAPAAAQVTLPTEIATVHPTLIRAWQGTDVAVFQPLFADSAVVVTPDARYTGWTEIRTGWIEPSLPGMSAFVATPTAFTREGDVIVETGTYSFNMKQDTGVQAMKGTYTQRWSRMPDGSWRITSVTIQ